MIPRTPDQMLADIFVHVALARTHLATSSKPAGAVKGRPVAKR